MECVYWFKASFGDTTNHTGCSVQFSVGGVSVLGVVCGGGWLVRLVCVSRALIKLVSSERVNSGFAAQLTLPDTELHVFQCGFNRLCICSAP